MKPPEDADRDLVARKPQTPGGGNVDGRREGSHDLQLGVDGECEEVVDRADRAQVLVARRRSDGEAAAPGYAVDEPFGDELAERLPHGLPADLKFGTELG